MNNSHQRIIFVVIALLMLVVISVLGSGCAGILDPCVSQRSQCYNNCPTVAVLKQVCQEKCNYDYDRCKGKPV